MPFKSNFIIYKVIWLPWFEMTSNVVNFGKKRYFERTMQMKHGKRLTVKQKRLLQSLNLNPENWLVCKNDSKVMIIEHRHTGTRRTIAKESIRLWNLHHVLIVIVEKLDAIHGVKVISIGKHYGQKQKRQCKKKMP